MNHDNPDNNIILTKTEGLTMGSAALPVDDRNKNILLIGGAGTGKTYFTLFPNLMQCHSSYVFTDPKGNAVRDCGAMLKKAGYRVKIFNTFEFEESMYYNPFAYFREDKLTEDIASFIDVLIKNTGEKAPGGDEFWTNCEKMLYTAFISYIFTIFPKQDRNINSVLELVTQSAVDGDNKSDVDIMFEVLEFWISGKTYKDFKVAYPEIALCGAFDEHFNSSPTEWQKKIGNYGIGFYKRFKQAAGKTMKSILISCSARLSPFATEGVAEKISRDELELDKLSDRKTALFIIIDDMSSTYNFLVTIMYSQLFTILSEKAYRRKNNRLKYHVRFLLDEFANCGRIPDFEKIIAVIRSRGISACVVLQALSQLKAIYKENSGTIIANCDSILFLGSQEWETVEWFSKVLGKETIDNRTYSTSKGSNSGSHSVNQQRMGKDLMSPDELLMLDGNKCVLKIRGVKPFLSMKNDPTEHKRYEQLSYKTGLKYDIKRAIEIESERLLIQRKKEEYPAYEHKKQESLFDYTPEEE